MPTTLLVRTPGHTRPFPLTGPLTIGRAAENDVVLENVDVSRRHAIVLIEASGPVYMDLGSANGSRVNGQEVEPRTPVALHPGDTVAIADATIELTTAGVSEETAVRAHAAGAAPPARQAGLLPGIPRALGGTVQVAIRPHIEVVTPGGTRDVVLEGDEVTFGRAPDNQVVVGSDVVSRHHLVLRRSGATYVAQDLGTTNGMTVSGTRVATHLLHEGDVIHIADEVSLRFHTAPEAAPQTPEEREVKFDERTILVVGRDPRCDLRLTHPTISKFHARVARTPDGRHTVEDLGSTNGTFVNGVVLGKGEVRMVGDKDVVQVGPVRLHLSDAGVRSEDHSRDIRLTAVHLNQRVSTKLNLLQDISVVIEPQEFVAVVGVSGSGKSTLLGALSGLRPATDGDVMLNGTSLYGHFEAFRTTLGYVPQDDILHRELPVGRALAYAAELRLPDDTPESERRARIENVTATLGLKERLDTPVGRLSGGQRKRVSIGAELLTQPGLFFLDEATSGLDPGTESQLMRLLRKLADEGHTILLITHATKNVMLCDLALFLAKGGNLAYFGPPDQALTYFGVPDFDGIYEKLEAEKSPEEWASLYRASRQYQEYVVGRLASQAGEAAAFGAGGGLTGREAPAPPAGRTSSTLHQLRVLSFRYFDIIRRDRVNFALLFLLAPMLALIDLVAWPSNVLDRAAGSGSTAMTMFFLSALVPFLVGSLSFVREIVKEAPIYARERAVALGIWPYLGSKVAIGTLFALYHGAALFLVKFLLIDFPGITAPDMAAFYVTLVLAVISGVMWALLISTLTSKEEQAMMLIIGLIVLQVVFSGGLVPISDMGAFGTVVSSANSTSWAFKALTAASGVDTTGCAGDFATCNMPGVSSQPDVGTRTLAFKGVDDQFSDIFGADVLVCWGAMVAIIAVLGVTLYVLQRRKDTL